MVGLLSGECGVVVRRLVKGKAAKRPALVPGGSIIRENDPCGALCWASVEDVVVWLLEESEVPEEAVEGCQ